MSGEFLQINIYLNRNDVLKLLRMMDADGLDNRSAFLRALVRREWERRNSVANSMPLAEPSQAREIS